MNKLEVHFPANAGMHTVSVTFLARDYAPNNDLNKGFLRSTIETGGIPGFSFLPDVGSVWITGPYDAKGASDTPSRRKIFTCHPTSSAHEIPCAKDIVSTLARRAFRRPVTDRDVKFLMGFYQRAPTAVVSSAGLRWLFGEFWPIPNSYSGSRGLQRPLPRARRTRSAIWNWRPLKPAYLESISRFKPTAFQESLGFGPLCLCIGVTDGGCERESAFLRLRVSR